MHATGRPTYPSPITAILTRLSRIAARRSSNTRSLPRTIVHHNHRSGAPGFHQFLRQDHRPQAALPADRGRRILAMASTKALNSARRGSSFSTLNRTIFPSPTPLKIPSASQPLEA
jgi:hypothetical protein